MTEKKNSGEVPETSPLQGTPTDRDTAEGSLAGTFGTGSDNLPHVPADAVGAQYQYGGTMPNVAPADAVQPAVGEVQL